jgi:D-3-phosphoglycerate dehydrogenase
MKVFIADKVSNSMIQKLEAIGAQVTVNAEISEAELAGVIGDSEVLIVRSKKVNAATINAATHLSLIVRAGAGVNTIDLDAANERGIHVTNCPGKNKDAVAELAIGLLIACDRRIVQAHGEMAAGSWNKKEFQKACGLKGRTLGVIGLGSIGTAVVERAKGLEMQVIAWSRSLTPEKAAELGIGYCSTLEAVAEQSDAISLHIAYSKNLKHRIGKDFFTRMKKGAILINTARGDIVDTAALKTAIREKGIKAGLDVFEGEPTGAKEPFLDPELASLAICTPHIGASTDQASEAICDEAVRIVKTFKESGKALNGVNVRKKTTAKYNLVVRHYNRVGVLASVLNLLRDEGVNIEEMENTIFEAGKAATCTLKLDSLPKVETVASLNSNPNIIKAMMT